MATLDELSEKLRRAWLDRVTGTARGPMAEGAPAPAESASCPRRAAPSVGPFPPATGDPAPAVEPSSAPDVAAQLAELARLREAHPRLAELLARLDPYQLAAVLDPAPALLVRAHVGSGKTTVLAHRLLYLHFACGVPLAQMAVLTFTNKAARELKERICSLYEPGALAGLHQPLPSRAFWLTGTFHGVARALLARALPVERLGYRPDFGIIDEHERAELWERLITEHRLRIKYRRQLERRMEGLARGGDGGYGRMKHTDDLPRLAELAKEEKKRLNVMDFDDLLASCRELLDRPLDPPLRWVLIDELQDCDESQLGLIGLLAGPGTGLFAVGDPNQVIYSWRGSTPRVFDALRARHGCREHELPFSYRCSATILEGARALLGERRGRGLSGVRGPGRAIVVRRHLDPFQDACYLVGRIRELSAGGVPYREMAVLYRTRRQAEVLRRVLEEAGVPCEEAARRSLRELPAVWWVVRLLRAALDPRRAALQSVLTDPLFGLLSPAQWERIGKSGGAPAPASPEQSGPPGAAAEAADAGETLVRLVAALERLPQASPAERDAEKFVRKIIELRRWLDDGTPLRTGPELLAWLELRRMLRPTSASHDEDVAQVARLLDDLALRWLAGEMSPAEGLRLGLNEAALGASPVLRWEIDPRQDSVKLMTLHAAKGLEFDHVFISGVNEGLLPLAGSRADPAREAEELRLLFVGLTRARDAVEISWHLQPEGFGVLPEPSSYLRRLPPALLEWSVATPAPAPAAAPATPPAPAAAPAPAPAPAVAPAPAPAVAPAPAPVAAPASSRVAPQAAGLAAVPPRAGAVALPAGAVAPPAEPALAAAPAASPTWRAGQAVRHPRYGAGTIVEVAEGNVRCAFPGFGERSFSVAFCPLVVVAEEGKETGKNHGEHGEHGERGPTGVGAGRSAPA